MASDWAQSSHAGAPVTAVQTAPRVVAPSRACEECKRYSPQRWVFSRTRGLANHFIRDIRKKTKCEDPRGHLNPLSFQRQFKDIREPGRVTNGRLHSR